MRLAIRFIVPLLVALGLVAWVAQDTFDRLTVRWFVRDLDMRTALIANAVEGPLVDLVQRDSGHKVERFLERVAMDERLYAIGLCDATGVLTHQTKLFPADVRCDAVTSPGRAAARLLDRRGSMLHVATHVLADEGGDVVVRMIVLHDMTFVRGRSATSRRYVFLLFVVIALVVSLVTVVIARLSLRGWVTELSAILEGRPAAARWTSRLGASDLGPVAADLRALLRDMEQDRRMRDDGQVPWSPGSLRALLDQHLKGQEVLIVSNREPYVHERRGDTIGLLRPASGLITALEPVARACGGTWIAHGGGSADRETVDARSGLDVPPEQPVYRLRRVWLTTEEENGYYYGFANSGLWPLCHNAHVRPSFLASDWAAYGAVNQKFAEAVIEEARTADPIVLVQDFHLALVPRLVRERLPAATIIAFWHIPWPNPEAFGICPWREELLAGLLGSSILGFHTQNHCNNFLDSVARYLEARVDRETFTVSFGGEPTVVQRYPISIEWPPQGAAMGVAVEECRAQERRRLGLAPDTKIVLGVDRLDYTKGIVERFLALERLLEQRPDWIGKVVFLQIAAPSRSRIEEYHAFEERVGLLARRINDRFGREGFRPIRLQVEHHEFERVLFLYRAADVCMVTSLHDGMNLVAKEFVAARDDEAGVLILSRFAGASGELHEALIVNPYDIDQCAEALATALAMPPGEQQDRMRNLRAIVQEFNVYRWAGRMLLDGARMRARRRVHAMSHRGERGRRGALAS
jgi:trehalose 6-phosphate synthase